MIRRFPAVAAAAAVVLTVTSGCSTFTKNDKAATAAGTSLSIDDFEALTDDLVDAGEFQLTAGGEVLGSDARGLLTQWITTNLLVESLADAGTPIDDAARKTAESFFTTADATLWGELGPVTQRFLVDDRAVNALLSKEAYEAGVETSNTLCLRAMPFTDEAAAQDAYAQLQGGADFGELADSLSSDPAASNGGIFINGNTGSECSSAAELNTAVTSAVVGLPVGEPSAPVSFTGSDGSTQYFIILQRPWSEVADSATNLVRQVLGAAIGERLANAGSVQIDSRYGVWDDTTHTVEPAR